MNNIERFKAIMNYESYDRMPILHYGFWDQTLEKWCKEGYLKPEEIADILNKNQYAWREANQQTIGKKLGFDFGCMNMLFPTMRLSLSLQPPFEPTIIEELEDGSRKVMNDEGVTLLERPDAYSIQSEIDHLLKDRSSWEKHYLPRLKPSEGRIDLATLNDLAQKSKMQDEPLGIYCGSLFGQIRDWIGIVNLSYLYVDDVDLYEEIINTVAEICYYDTKLILSSGAKFDFAFFWEDICYRNGPLVSPDVFSRNVGPHYRRITELLRNHGIEIITLDCDGKVDELIPIWFKNGIKTMFPIEVGTWGATIRPWRDKYGKELKGVGGMDKRVFAFDYHAIDVEIERLRPLVDLGAYIPMPDHRIPPDAKWENVQYYCEKMRTVFS